MGVKEPWKEIDFQDKILDLQIRRERDAEKIAKNGRVWLDRGVIDGLAYEQLAGRAKCGRTAARIMQRAAKPYEKVFLIENLGHCRKNGIRRENQEEALELEKLQEQNYYEAGYDVIRIPAGPLEKRLEKVLKEIEEYGGEKNGKRRIQTNRFGFYTFTHIYRLQNSDVGESSRQMCYRQS